MALSNPTKRLSRAKATWLAWHTSEWVTEGLIDEDTRSRIMGSYEVASAERRSLLALMVLGALMFGIGVLLLIGYNWAQIPAAGKIAIILSSVAAAFGASAGAFARQHLTAGETLAFIGVLLFGNAIWLIAQVLHIQGSFSDAFMWWAIGALACAWLVRSHVVGVGAALLVLVWVIAAGHTVDRPVLSFAAICLATVALAYEQKSPWMLSPALVSAIVWVAWVPDRVQPGLVSVGVAALMGCAYYAAGASHRAQHPLRRSWQVTGLCALVVMFVPLLVTDFHRVGTHYTVAWSSLVVALAPLLATAALLLRQMTSEESKERRRSMWLADTLVLATAAAITAWMCLLAAGYSHQPWFEFSATVAFSVSALALSIAFIHKALGSDSGLDLTFGVLFALAFLLVRWGSLIDSMLWSGVMLLLASAGFFAIARLWQHRERRRPPVLTPSATGSTR